MDVCLAKAAACLYLLAPSGFCSCISIDCLSKISASFCHCSYSSAVGLVPFFILSNNVLALVLKAEEISKLKISSQKALSNLSNISSRISLYLSSAFCAFSKASLYALFASSSSSFPAFPVGTKPVLSNGFLASVLVCAQAAEPALITTIPLRINPNTVFFHFPLMLITTNPAQ